MYRRLAGCSPASSRVGHVWACAYTAPLDWSRHQIRKNYQWNSPPPMNTLKIHLRVKQFSPITNWKLAKRLLPYNQGFVYDPHMWMGWKWMKDQGCRPMTLGKSGVRKRWRHTVRDPRWCVGAWEPQTRRPPVLGSYTERQALLAAWRATGTNKRPVGSLNSTHEEHTSAGLPTGQA